MTWDGTADATRRGGRESEEVETTAENTKKDIKIYRSPPPSCVIFGIIGDDDTIGIGIGG